MDAAAAVAQPSRKGVWELGLIAFGALVATDVLTMFLAGAMHLEGILMVALSVFVYIQMGMTAASILSIPVTLAMRVAGGGKPKGGAKK